MKIGIYARGLTEKSGGVKVYIHELTKALIEIIPKNDELYIFHNASENIFKTKENVHEILLKSKNKIITDFISAPRELNKHNLDVILFPKNVIPYFIKAKKVLTIHDLAYYMPEFDAYKFFDTLYMKFMIKSSCKRADRIISVSENTKKDIIRILGINADKITPVHEGVDEKFRVIKDKKKLDSLREKYNLKNEFIFYAGSISPRKNIKRLISAFQSVQEKTKMDLVITGNKLWNNEEEMALIKQNPRIKVLGLVPDEDLPLLYNLASMYVYPSLYEGFGLPILEAQACGCPIIASNASSLPEVAGQGGALFVDPYKEEEIAQAILMLDRKNGKMRAELVKSGFRNVKNFSWINSARESLGVVKNGG
ncbi:MAG: glycosyltransferase family 1 protein [Nanoarchaeota archaeon]|nr:glycosyltransferase family 1 protein [Nanoarchaeota archaeon]